MKELIIAGPCSAESREQVIETAMRLKATGMVNVYRAGLWKPRTMPGGFEGVGEDGAGWLVEAERRSGIPVATEVARKRHLDVVLESGIRNIWIGARTSADPFAIQELSDTLKQHISRDKRLAETLNVWVKNPINPDIGLWIGAMQRIRNAGVRKIGAIHRGFSVYGEHPYRNMPEWRIATELKLRYPGLPLIFDPSHVGGNRDLIAPLSQQALTMGYDGLMIECHSNPDEALSDAKQQISPDEFVKIMKSLRPRHAKITEDEELARLRDEIDNIDMQLLECLAQRMSVSREIGKYKQKAGMAVVQPERYNDMLQSRIHTGEVMGIAPEFLRKFLLMLHDESVRQQY